MRRPTASRNEKRLIGNRYGCSAMLIFVIVVMNLIQAKYFWGMHMQLWRHLDVSMSGFDQPVPSSSAELRFPPLPLVPKNESFGACFVVKGDNDLLSEWIPYHYTILPLRYLVVVTDDDNKEDPTVVLKKWTTAQTDLNWWVFNISEFESIHGEFDAEAAFKSSLSKIHRKEKMPSNGTIHPKVYEEFAHKKLIHKQNAMITHCTKFMKERGVRWTSLYDTDEFLAINRIGADEQREQRNKTIENAETSDDTYGVRPYLPPIDSNATVVDIIQSFQKAKEPLESCHVLPRVLFGASENITCPGSEDVKAFARENFNYPGLSTLRFQQHAAKTDFENNKFGKVFVDVSNISDDLLAGRPRNIHRPFPGVCKRPIVSIQDSPFYLMHYVGRWERFQAKNDTRRGYKKWREMADVSDSTSCCQQEAYRWLHRFVDQVGLRRARFLLGE